MWTVKIIHLTILKQPINLKQYQIQAEMSCVNELDNAITIITHFIAYYRSFLYYISEAFHKHFELPDHRNLYKNDVDIVHIAVSLSWELWHHWLPNQLVGHLIIIKPWFFPTNFKKKRVHAARIDQLTDFNEPAKKIYTSEIVRFPFH